MLQVKIPSLKSNVRGVRQTMSKETDKLAKGLYIAMSNASIKKGQGGKPKPGSKKASGQNWRQGNDLYVEYMAGHRQIREPVTTWIERLKNKDAVETYTDKSGKPRRRKVSKYNVIRLQSQHAPGVFFEHDVWRVGSKGALPFSWGAKGDKSLANYYLRKQWRYTAEQLAAEVRISPAKFSGETNNDRVLRLLDEGGSGYGSRRLLGFQIIFRARQNGRQNIGIKKIYDEPKQIRFKPFNLKRQVLARTRRVLKRVPPSKILPSQWRQISSGQYGK